TATDHCGNSSTKSQTITVQDKTGPVVRCPGNISSACNVPTTFTATATDNCSGNVPVTCVPPSGTVFPTGPTTVTCRAVDAGGNSGSCSFTVPGQSCGGRLAPTATTCGDFTGGTAGDQTDVCYGIKSNKIGNASPGVFFYYTRVTSNVNGTFVVKVEQSKNN